MDKVMKTKSNDQDILRNFIGKRVWVTAEGLGRRYGQELTIDDVGDKLLCGHTRDGVGVGVHIGAITKLVEIEAGDEVTENEEPEE